MEKKQLTRQNLFYERRNFVKIAFLSFFNGLYDRGVETMVYEVGNRLAEKHDLFVFQSGQKQDGSKYKTIEVPSSWQPKDLEHGLSLKRRLFLDRTSIFVKKFTEKILPTLRKEKFDIIIPWNNGWQSLLIKLSRLGKMVAVGQSGLGWDDRVLLYLFPERFVGFTDYQLEWAKRVNPFVRLEKIPNGVARRFFENDQKLNLKIENPVILTVAAYTSIKRLDLAIRAVSKMQSGSLVMVGKGELEDDLRNLAGKLLPGRHLFLKVSYPNLQRAYKAANVFTFPSVSWESFGIVMLEAMASGLPVVANDDPIRREIVGDAGLFVDPAKTDEYALAITKALKTNWGDKPRKQAEKFDWDKIAIKYEELFKELIK